MAKKKRSGKGRSGSFVRDAAGRFATAAGAGLGRVAKQALAAGEEELTAVAQDAARRAVKAADEQWKAAREQWNAAKKNTNLDDAEFNRIKRDYEDAVRNRAAARANAAEK